VGTVLFEPGDRVPALVLVRAARVLPGDVVWGIQYQENLRKGFLLDTEGTVVEKGAEPVGNAGGVRLASWVLTPDRMVLVEAR
jgi:hypothetical protein